MENLTDGKLVIEKRAKLPKGVTTNNAIILEQAKILVYQQVL